MTPLLIIRNFPGIFGCARKIFYEYITLLYIDFLYYKMATSDDLDDFADFSLKLFNISLQLRNTLLMSQTQHTVMHVIHIRASFFRTFPKEPEKLRLYYAFGIPNFRVHKVTRS